MELWRGQLDGRVIKCWEAWLHDEADDVVDGHSLAERVTLNDLD